MTVPIKEIMNYFNIFWQYPVITEKKFYESNNKDIRFIGLPWATIIDKRINIQDIYDSLSVFINKNENYYTCCQHIYFKKLVPLFKMLNIKTVYSPHKIKDEDILDNVIIKPFPLYAVNIEDKSRNNIFQNINFIDCNREYLYSFKGAYNDKYYISDIRKKIFDMTHPSNCYIENTDGWFYESIVYSKQQNSIGDLNKSCNYDKNTEKYNEVLLNSRFSLCPSGSGPNSIRFWESLAVGAIPIILSNTLELPPHPLWKSSILRIDENKLTTIPSVLENININDELLMRKNCLILYNDFKDFKINM